MSNRQGKLSISFIVFLALLVAFIPFFSVLTSVPKPVLADSGLVDLSTYTLGGSDNATYITDATPYRTNVNLMPLGVDAYRYKDYTADHFTGNFTHYLEARLEASNGAASEVAY